MLRFRLLLLLLLLGAVDVDGEIRALDFTEEAAGAGVDVGDDDIRPLPFVGRGDHFQAFHRADFSAQGAALAHIAVNRDHNTGFFRGVGGLSFFVGFHLTLCIELDY